MPDAVNNYGKEDGLCLTRNFTLKERMQFDRHKNTAGESNR
jgi:hypothetical protein